MPSGGRFISHQPQRASRITYGQSVPDAYHVKASIGLQEAVPLLSVIQ
jgi:hypothetical protein